jgi:SAM-dependent methyltransferase
VVTAALASASGDRPARPVFDAALDGSASHLELGDGRRLPVPVQRWHAAAAGPDRWMIERCVGPTVDLGCGPGRLVAALVARGVPAIGVDHSAHAVRLCRARGLPAVRRDLFDRLPGERWWAHALLADGNIGIGGDPRALLCRAAALLGRRGSVLVETGPASERLWRGPARLRRADGRSGPWFPWATVGVTALAALARQAGLRTVDALTGDECCTVQLALGKHG